MDASNISVAVTRFAKVATRLHSGWILVGAVGMLLLFFTITVLDRLWNQPTPDDDSDTVAREWNLTIAKLGLDPIYPPAEDFAVGDILVYVSGGDAGGEAGSDKLLGRSIKVWHIDLTKELKEAYRNTYAFPDTLPRPKNDDEYWPQQVVRGSIFDVAADRPHLPLVLMPGFTIARIRQADTSGGWVSRTMRAIGVIEADDERSIEVKIPFAETYGVSAIIANGYLLKFCSDPRFHNVCTENGARGFLSTLVGKKATERVSPKIDPKEPYRLQAEMLIVSRVYLTRSIQTVVSSASNVGAQAAVFAQLNEALQRLDANAPPPSNATSRAASGLDTETAALRTALDEQKSRLKTLIAQVAESSPGGNLSIQSVDARRISVTQPLQRPVAFAFGAIRTNLLDK
jgi:hypothetical protein